MYDQTANVCEHVSRVSAIPDSDVLLAPLRQGPADPVILGGVLLKAKLGEGGVAGVYLGWHTRLKTQVAVKILKDPSPDNLPQFLREARLTVSVDHPNLVRVLDVNVEPASGLYYIIMEYVEGCSAYQLLERQMARQSRPLTQVAALEIGLCAARALGAAHREGIVHRDVKSDNILIRERDGVVKVADLGFAGRWRSDSAVAGRRHSTVSGTTGFLSPEVLLGEDATPAADVYGLGATLYELLTSVLPYGAPYDESYYQRQVRAAPPDIRVLKPHLDAAVAALVARCLALRPEDRFADGDELAAALENLVHQLAGTKVLRKLDPVPADEVHRPVVLCVDDDEGALSLLEDILAAQGFQPVCFSDPQAALKSLSLVKPDVAVVDMNMPKLTGVQLCQGLRMVDGFHELAVLIVSGQHDPNAVHEALARGITDYLSKPVSTQELVVRVKLLAKLRSMNRERSVIETQLLRLKGRHGSEARQAIA